MSEDNFIIDTNTPEYESVDVVDMESNVGLDESIHIIEIEESESPIIETFDAFNALGEPNEQLKHQLLNGRDAADQHPITAITGLKGELDNIKALKTVYSDEKQCADYYEWEDGNILQESRIGYFVSLCPDSKSIKICDGSNVFGVVVDNAAFVGGQADIPRDCKYGLVTSVGYALVRCEMDVQVGNCVISNSYGMAQNTSNNYGCRVIGINNINGVRYALISLNVSIDQIDSIGDDVRLFDERLHKAEGDIVSAINVANQAHNKAQDIEHTSNEAIDKSNQAVNKSEEANNKAEGALNQSQSSFEASARAEALAQSAAVTTEAAKQTFVEVKDQVGKISEHISDVEKDLEQSKSNIEAMEEELTPLKEWKDEKDPNNYGISGFVAKADENEAQIGLLAGFEYGNNQNVYPYINTPVNDEGVHTTGDVLINGITFTDKGDTSVLAAGTASNNADFYIVEGKSFEEGEYCIFGCPNDGSLQTYCILFKQEKTDGTIKSFVSIGEDQLYEYIVDGSGNISLGEKIDRIIVETTDTISIWIRVSSGATVAALTFVPCLKKYYKGISGLRNQVAKNGSSIDLLTSHSFEGGSGTAGLILQVSENSAKLSGIASWQSEKDEAISAIKTDVSENYAKKTEIISLVNKGVSDAKTGILDEVSKTYATQESFTSYQNSINNSFTSIKQQSDADGASIRLLASSINKHSVGEFSQAYGFTLEQARDVLEEGMVYVPTVDHTETYDYTVEVDGEKMVQQYPNSDGYHFTTGYVYKWEIVENGALSGYMWAEYKNQVAFSGIKPITQIPYWYTNVADGLENGYEPYVLYKAEYYTDENGDPITRWISVATLQGNSQNRAMSQIRQDANSIDLKVTDVQGSVAGLEASVEKAETSIGLVVAKTDGGDVINAASIVTAINNQTDETAINLNADRINLEGLVTANKTFSIDTNGYMRAIGGTIGGWVIEAQEPETFGKVLFIGDSYTTNREYTSSDPEFAIGWPEYCAERLGLNEDQYYDAGVGGHGFLAGQSKFYFLNLLNDGVNYIKDVKKWDLSEVSHIIIGGGFNDKTLDPYIDGTIIADGNTVTGIKNAIITLDNKIKELFTTNKPKVVLFAMGKSATSNQKNYNLEQYVYPAYKEQSLALGWRFYDIHNEWVGRDNVNFCADNYHPNEAGLKTLGKLVASICSRVKGRLYNPPIGDPSVDDGFYLSNKPDDWAIEIGKKAYDYSDIGGSSTLNRAFLVSKNGTLWARNAHIAGTINSNVGNIGGWTLRNGYLTSTQTTDGDGYYVKSTTNLRAVPETPLTTYGVFGIRYQGFNSSDNSMISDYLPFLISSDGSLTVGDDSGAQVRLSKGYIQFFMNALTGTPKWCGSLSPYDGGILFNGNNKKIYGQFTDGSKVDMIYVNSSNQIVIGNEIPNLNGVKIYHGATYKSTLFNSQGIVFQNNGMELRGRDYSNTSLHMMSIRNDNNLMIGTTALAGNVNIYTQYGYATNFYNGSSAVCSIYSDHLKLHGTNGICIDDDYYVLQYDGYSVNVGTGAHLLNLYGDRVLCNGNALAYASDKRVKNSIKDLSDKYIDMIDILSAKSYKYNEQTDDVINCGFVAQDVLSALNELGLSREDFGGFVDIYRNDSKYALDYTQFIPILWENVKKLKREIVDLKTKLEEKGE